MGANAADSVFAGSVPETYEKYLVPLIFQHYAADIATRAAATAPGRVLEIAAGTGVVTRVLASTLPAGTTIVATDLNPPMLAIAAAAGTKRPVEWKQADAMLLPFEDEAFDAIVCQFGVMFFPDRGKAFAQMRRVLRPGGTLIFNAWDRIAENEFAYAVTMALAEIFPQNPPRFMVNTPHGYHDLQQIRRDIAAGGFTAAPDLVTLPGRSRADSAQNVAIAFCQGTPLRGEIEARGAPGLAAATAAAAIAIAKQWGQGAVEAKMQANIVTVHK